MTLHALPTSQWFKMEPFATCKCLIVWIVSSCITQAFFSFNVDNLSQLYLHKLYSHRDFNDETLNELTVGLVTEVVIPLRMENARRNAFLAQLIFSVPIQQLSFLGLNDVRIHTQSCTLKHTCMFICICLNIECTNYILY